MTMKDADGKPFDGDKSYRLTVPGSPPVKQYWSATVYDNSTHALVREVDHYSRASNTLGIESNADGSVDLFLGPRAPAGKEQNWMPTKPGARFEVLFRLYGPEKALFDKTWTLPDIAVIP
ncbi:DUF1214 domain-containing protein [Rhizobium sp. YTU87027]|uniref:DUF1214 domain-containing protein n=1 Tax=Rhizobium sp. YTU87027 TaxID=3417741 RepID=UPI003D69E482